MRLKICISDSLGNAHIAEVVPTNDEGGFRLVCTNSGEELARGEEKAGPNGHRYVYISGNDPIFTDHGVLEYQVERQFNERLAA